MSEERELLVREFPVELSETGDGRTVEARIVPYNTPTLVADRGGPPYTETWIRGAFDKQTRAADKVKVLFNFEHEEGIRGVIGHGVALEDRADALYGTFRIHENADGDKALQLVRDGLLTGISLEAIVIRSRNVANGVVERVRAHLDKVSLCRFPAFEEAQVIAVREAPEEPEPEEPAPEPEPEPDSARHDEVDAALERIGIEPLVRRAISRRPWSGSAARFTDDEYERSALICRPGDDPPKTRCSLPVLEPNGDVNTNALGAAAARLNQVTGITPAMRSTAARKLMRLYRMADMEPPEMLRMMASR